MNSFNFLFETSPSSIVDYEMLFLWFSSAVPSTVESSLLDDVVRDGESTLLPLTKFVSGFVFYQEMSTSAIDHFLIRIKKAF